MHAQVTLEFDFIQKTGTERRAVAIHSVIVGGWTGRDKEALAHHVEELQKLGVAPPVRTPLFYRVGVSRLTQAQAIEVIGTGSSGEVEYVLLQVEDRLWIGVASDHTDRHVERMGITVAKQLCDKPVAGALWPLDEVEPHWDWLLLRSHVVENGETRLYQEDRVATLLSPRELLARFADEGQAFGSGMLMFGGTCTAIGGVRHAPAFSFELVDSVLERAIRHSYSIQALPIEG